MADRFDLINFGKSVVTTTGGTTANVNIDANTLFIDGTNNRVGVGTNAPTAALQVAGDIVSSGTIVPASSYLRNRIINGDMRIDQRNNGSSVTGVGGSSIYAVDRFYFFNSQSSRFTAQRNAGSVTPPVGFTNYLGITSSSAYSALSTDIFTLGQVIEGFNTDDLWFGTANARTVTLSFWVRSSLTGTFSGAILNGNLNRSYPYTYTISASNTWEQKTITIPGDTTGTWNTSNGAGMFVAWDLGTGSSRRGTAGAWVGSQIEGVTGSVSVVGTSGATLYITGVQLEVGSVATPFERRQFGHELILCQRYYASQSSSLMNRAYNYAASTFDAWHFVTLPTTMRVAPTVTAVVDINDGANTTPSFIQTTTTSFCLARYALTSTQFLDLNSWTATAEY